MSISGCAFDSVFSALFVCLFDWMTDDHADVDWHCGDGCSSTSAISVRCVHVYMLTTEAWQVTGTNSVRDYSVNSEFTCTWSDAVAFSFTFTFTELGDIYLGALIMECT